ncbi:hypothetical protein BJ875DRAFT_508205 [Amylocarpus encephaloides]|uniref:Histone-lysine N-methyltransferase, H3 lysine-9 specific dim-5 n=1 Tax=Amylocarpus encephaloides TaxID=45428 RepID=A0A9P7Y8B5_9HELO|nr:hypothetical protein BJ875DRAFT_508205 [Amylocarpus encephaloides]
MATFRDTFMPHFKGHPEGWLPAEKDCHWCQIATYKTHGTAYVSIINRVDEVPLQTNFLFIESSEPGEGIILPDPNFFSGCDCRKSGHCKTGRCTCHQDMADPDDVVYETIDGKSYLSEEFLESRDPIYECHSACSCPALKCPNRVVERGRTIPLTIFRTTDGRGWGVKSPNNIKKGQFVDCYIGEIITAEETEIRRQNSDVAAKKDVYLFELDKFKDDASRDESLAETVYIDGEFKSGPSRFINHSCDPNLRIFARVGDHAMKRFHELAFFAIKDIPHDTELTFDYVDGEDKLEQSQRDPSQRKEMTRCLCKSKKCRGYLW